MTTTNDGNEGHGPEVLYEVDGHVATITLNRPHRRNAISVTMLQLLADHLTEADEDDNVRAVLLTGAGKSFCAGLDIKDAVAGTGIGAVVPESGGTWYLPRLLGWAKAAEPCYLGRDVDAAEAERSGLVNRAVPDAGLLGEARAWADEIAANAPLAVRAMRRLFRHGMIEDFASHTHHVLLQTIQLFGTKDFEEGMVSFMEKRPPEFRGR